MKTKLKIAGSSIVATAIFAWIATFLFHPSLLNKKGAVLTTDSYVIPTSIGKLITVLEEK